MICKSCNKKINSSDTLYRCCDANVCSLECSYTRKCNIEKIDNKLSFPVFWDTDISMNNKEVFGLDIINSHWPTHLKTNQNLRKNIYKKNEIIKSNNFRYERFIINCTITFVLGVYIKKQFLENLV